MIPKRYGRSINCCCDSLSSWTTDSCLETVYMNEDSTEETTSACSSCACMFERSATR